MKKLAMIAMMGMAMAFGGVERVAIKRDTTRKEKPKQPSQDRNEALSKAEQKRTHKAALKAENIKKSRGEV